MAPALKPGLLDGVRPAPNVELPWRVLSLLNVFRLLLPMLLLLVFFFNAPTNSVGAAQPGLFIGIAVAYFAFALVCIQTLQARTLSAEWQALIQLFVDAVAIGMLIHASGGVSSGLATLLVLPTGATATILTRRYALLGTSMVTFALLIETSISFLQGEGSKGDFLITGLTGASLFAITLLAIPFAARLRESEALARQREIDLANLNELNEFIVQHLRESILVVDDDRPGAPDQRDGGAAAQGRAGAGWRHARGGVAAAGLPAAGLAQPDPRPPRQRGRSGRRRRRHGDPAAFRGAVGERRGPGADFPGGHQRHCRPPSAVQAGLARAAQRQHRARDP